MAACDLLKDTAGYKLVLKAVLKGQIQQLVQQLADQTDEESIILTASMTDGAISHLGSDSVKGFLENHEDIKSEFLDFCFTNCQKQRLQKNNHGSIKGVQTPSNLHPLLQPSLKQGVIRSSPSPRYSPYTVKRTPSNKRLNLENISSQNAISTVVSKPVTMVTKSPKVVTDDSIIAQDKIPGNIGKFSSVNEMSKSRADQNVKTIKQSSVEEDTFKKQPQFQNEATFQSKTEKTLLDSDYGSMPGSDNSNKVIPEGASVNSGFANDADQPDSDSTVDMDSYVTVKVEPESDQELEEAGESLDSHEHFSDSMQQSYNEDDDNKLTMYMGAHPDEYMQQNEMVEISAGTGICLPFETFTTVLMKGRTRAEIGVRLLRAFFNADELADAGKLANLPKETVEAVIACALWLGSPTPRGTELPPAKRCQIKKALHNVVAYERRDKDEMKRRAKLHKMSKESNENLSPEKQSE